MNPSLLPGLAPLYVDYVTRFEGSALRQFFPHSPLLQGAEYAQWLRKQVGDTAHAHNRANLVTALRKQCEEYDELQDSVVASLELLEHPDTFAVVTGQQVGILGGSLYTLYKTASAINLAREYSVAFPEFNFVPVFWLETEDHDLAEILSVNVLDRAGEAVRVDYAAKGNSQPFRRRAAGETIEGESVEEFFALLRERMSPTEFTGEAFHFFERHYRHEVTFARAFRGLLSELFSSSGLIIVDASTKAFKTLATDLFLKEIETSPALSDSVVLQTAVLEEQYQAQVKPRALNLFLVEGRDRYGLLEKEENGERLFTLQGTRKSITVEELRRIAREETERLSPNVVLRPLYQDTLFPTAAYVAGPGEIAYFAQLLSAYEYVGLEMPRIAPRLSATLTEARFEKLLTKLDLSWESLLVEGSRLTESVIESLAGNTAFDDLKVVEGQIENLLESVRPTLNQIDPNLEGTLSATKGKVLTAIKDLQAKAESLARKRHSTTRDQLEKVIASIHPHGNFQERELNLIYFLNKYGPSFWPELRERLFQLPGASAEHWLLPVGHGSKPAGPSLLESGSEKSPAGAENGRTSAAVESLVGVAAEGEG